MNRRNATRNALITSVVSLLLCVTMLLGTTFAWFTDSVTSANNIIKSGNLDVELEWSKSYPTDNWQTVKADTELFDDATLWEPGHTEVVYLRVKNAGSLALNYKLGLNPVSEKGAYNVAGEWFELSKYIKFDVTEAKTYDRAAAQTAANAGTSIYASFDHPLYDAGSLEKGATSELALVVYMPETVGNEANYRGTAPSIQLGVNLVATQKASEEDSFGTDYDSFGGGNNIEQAYPQSGVGVGAPKENENVIPVTVRSTSTNAKLAEVQVPVAALAEDAENIEVKIVPTAQDENVTITSEQEAQSFDITVEGIKEGNTEKILVSLRVGEGLTGLKVYHNGTPVTIKSYSGEYVTFETTSFSPYTVVYDKTPVEDDSQLDQTVPTAGVAMYDNANIEINTDGWKSFDGWQVSNPEQRLEEAFIFTAQEDDVNNSAYKDWLCDFYVSMDREVPAGAVCLGGNYGGYGWVGFENKDTVIAAGDEIGLLATAIGRGVSNFTYANVIGLVDQFKCGVARTYGTDEADLAGATLTVVLRMTNPDDHSDVKNIVTVKYTFGEEFGTGTSVIENSN